MSLVFKSVWELGGCFRGKNTVLRETSDTVDSEALFMDRCCSQTLGMGIGKSQFREKCGSR